MSVNSTVPLGGRLGNHIIRNIFLSQLAEKGDLPITYGYHEHMKLLGIPLFTTGKTTYDRTETIKEFQEDNYLDKPVNFNIILGGYAQTPKVSMCVYNYFRNPDVKKSIMGANKYNHFYGKNDHVYVHVRLDDATDWSPGFSYYDNAIKATGATSGYISSDTPDHEMVKRLSEKYGFPILRTEKDSVVHGTTSFEAIDTIMLAITSKYLVLSHGTFSWVIGAMAFDAEKIFIPPKRFIDLSGTTNFWVGDIYHIESWKVIEP